MSFQPSIALLRGILEEFAERAARPDTWRVLPVIVEYRRLALNARRGLHHERDTETLSEAARRLGASRKALAMWLRDAGITGRAATRGAALRLPSSTFDRVVSARRAVRARPAFHARKRAAS